MIFSGNHYNHQLPFPNISTKEGCPSLAEAVALDSKLLSVADCKEDDADQDGDEEGIMIASKSFESVRHVFVVRQAG